MSAQEFVHRFGRAPTLVVPHCSFFVRRLQIGGQISNNSAADCFRDRQLNSEQFHRFRGRLSPTRLEEKSHLEDLRVAEVEQLDVRMKENKVVEYRARVRASFRYHPEKH
ncbi:MAG: dodecin domain-containing protein [Rhodoplanes sp.]